MKITLTENQKLYFTSDTHYHHSNICRGVSKWDDRKNQTRDFNTLDEMNEVIVKNINNTVNPNDILVHLGDWSFGGFEKIEEFRNKIFCKNIFLIFGNHDTHIKNNKENIQNIFSGCFDYLDLEIITQTTQFTKKSKFICFHFPIASWDGLSKGVIHLHGHVHLPKELRLSAGKSMDVGVDGNNLYPISLNEVLDIMHTQPLQKLTLPKDHHENI